MGELTQAGFREPKAAVTAAIHSGGNKGQAWGPGRGERREEGRETGRSRGGQRPGAWRMALNGGGGLPGDALRGGLTLIFSPFTDTNPLDHRFWA